ncbi:Site-specific recombinase XerD [Caenispirillum bisanense]|uniref:Site-specific recombinase XerD n=1 Tax=Caenispirillum bisanense TaxID=414052 RepID=A0A286GQJ5_9PROT|nr:integrase family protein [Caenispirillum bisanense]SOD97244.1 Site-specific recombinase XerD [Caenispirillum bisanense]
MKLRDSAIRAIKPTSERERYRFDGYPGLALRVTPRGVKTWVYHYRVRGTGTQRELTIGRFDTIGEADIRERYNDLRKRVARGEDPAAPPPPKPQVLTVRDLVDFYFKKKAELNEPVRASSEAEARRLLSKDILDASCGDGSVYGDLPADQLTEDMIREILARIVGRGAPVVANRLLAWLKKVYAIGVSEKKVTESPCRHIRRPHREKERSRVLSLKEFGDLWSALWSDTAISRSIKLALLFLMIVPARRSEILKLKAGDIGADGFVELQPEDVKQDRLQRYYIPEPARKLVDGIEEGYLFPSPRVLDRPIAGRSISQAVRRYFTAWGLKKFTPHDLRRSLSTFLASSGIDKNDISRILGHQVDGDVTGRIYVQFSYDPVKREAGRALEALFSNVLSDEPAASMQEHEQRSSASATQPTPRSPTTGRTRQKGPRTAGSVGTRRSA